MEVILGLFIFLLFILFLPRGDRPVEPVVVILERPEPQARFDGCLTILVIVSAFIFILLIPDLLQQGGAYATALL